MNSKEEESLLALSHVILLTCHNFTEFNNIYYSFLHIVVPVPLMRSYLYFCLSLPSFLYFVCHKTAEFVQLSGNYFYELTGGYLQCYHKVFQWSMNHAVYFMIPLPGLLQKHRSVRNTFESLEQNILL